MSLRRTMSGDGVSGESREETSEETSLTPPPTPTSPRLQYPYPPSERQGAPAEA